MFAPFLAVPFIVWVVGIIAAGLAAMAQSQSSAYQGWLSSYLGRVSSILEVPLTAALDLARWIAHKVGEHYAGIERLTVAWVGALAHYAKYVIEFAIAGPLQLWVVLDWLVHVHIPNVARAFTHNVVQPLKTLPAKVEKITTTVYKFPKLSQALAKKLIAAAITGLVAPYLLPLRWLRDHFHALTVALGHALPIPRGWTPTQIRRFARKAIRDYTLTAAFALAVAGALTRLQLNWLRCSSLRRLGKRVGCGGFGLLESFIADAFEVFLVTNLCTFIYLMQRAAEQIRPELLAFVDVENALIGCHGNVAPKNLKYTSFLAPTVENTLALAA